MAYAGFAPIGSRMSRSRDVAGYPIRASWYGTLEQPDATWLLVHGMVETDEVWRPVLDALPEGICAVTLEMPWSGTRDSLWGLKMAPEAWILAALDAHGVVPDAIAGHSFGANAVLQMLAQQAFPQLRQLILISPFYKPTTADMSWPLFQNYVGEFDRFIGLSMTVRASDRKLSDEMFAVIRDKLRDSFGCYSWVQFWQLFSRTPFLPLQQLAVPSLVITGADDFSSPLDDVRALVSRLPDARLVVYPDCSHFCLTTREKEAVSHITDFMRDVPLFETPSKEHIECQL
jgi:pimeloyl-ACP methyl ester carboxylesterase